MIKKMYVFSVSTRYVGSEVKEEIEIEFTEEQYNDEEKREQVIQEYYEDWLWENIDTSWREQE